MRDFSTATDPDLINDLQTRGMRLVDPRAGHESRRGVPTIRPQGISFGDNDSHGAGAHARLHLTARICGRLMSMAARALQRKVPSGAYPLPNRPKFYDLTTADGIPITRMPFALTRRFWPDNTFKAAFATRAARKPASSVPSPEPGRRAYDCTQDARATGRGRKGCCGTRWRQAYGDDHRYAAGQGSWRSRSGRQRARP